MIIDIDSIKKNDEVYLRWSSYTQVEGPFTIKALRRDHTGNLADVETKDGGKHIWSLSLSDSNARILYKLPPPPMGAYLKVIPTPSASMTCAGAVVMVNRPHEVHPYVVWWYNFDCGGFNYGDYVATRKEADAAFEAKLQRYS